MGVGVLVAGIIAWGPAATPSDPRTIEVETIAWKVPPSCPALPVVRARVEQLIGRPLRDGDEAVQIEAEVRAADPTTMTLRVRSETGARERTITASNCEELTEIAAVVIAVAVDPSSSLMPEPQPETPEPAPVVAPPVVPPVASTPTRAPRRRRLQGGTLRAGVGLGLGALPEPTATVGGGVGLRFTHARVDLDVEHWIRQRALGDPSDLAVDVRLLVVRAQGCWVPTAARLLEFPLCAGAALGAMHGAGVGVPRPDPRRVLWADAHLQAGLLVAPLAGRRWFAFGPMARLQVPLVRPSFSLDGFGVLHRTKPAAFVAGFVAELRFP